MPPRRRRWLAVVPVLGLVAALLGVRCQHRAGRQHDADEAQWVPFADGVARTALDGTSLPFSTGSERFDGEWALVTCQMSILGLQQVADRFPERRADYAQASAACVDRMLSDELLAFGAAPWGLTPDQVRSSPPGHAWLGYLALALGRHRQLQPDTPHAAFHDRLITALAAAVDAAPHGLIATYPGEAYPADTAAVIGAIAEHGGFPEVVERWRPRFRAAAVDPATGLLRQHVSVEGRMVDGPRASGTAIGCVFLHRADPELSADLWTALRRQLRHVPGFAAVREHPAGVRRPGDIDSGPLILGTSVSATGFAIGCARRNGDRAAYIRLVTTSDLFGLPYRWGGERHYAVGFALGDAILLAMGTAAP